MDSETQIQIIRICLHVLASILVFTAIWYRKRKIVLSWKKAVVIGFFTGLFVWIFYFLIRSLYYTFNVAYALHFSDSYILLKHIIIEGIIGAIVFVVLISLTRFYFKWKK